jgi:hypothetical protein
MSSVARAVFSTRQPESSILHHRCRHQRRREDRGTRIGLSYSLGLGQVVAAVRWLCPDQMYKVRLDQ